MMMDNYFRCDQLCIVPCQINVWVVGDFCKPFEQVAGLGWCACKAPEVGRPLEGDAHHILGRIGFNILIELLRVSGRALIGLLIAGLMIHSMHSEAHGASDAPVNDLGALSRVLSRQPEPFFINQPTDRVVGSKLCVQVHACGVDSPGEC